MKKTIIFLILFLTGLDIWAQTNAPTLRQVPRRRPSISNDATATPAPTPSVPGFPAPALPANSPTSETTPVVPPTSGDVSPAPTNAAPAEEMVPAGFINFQGVDLNQVLEVYSQLVGRTLLRAALPSAQIVLKTATPLTKTEAIEALQAVLSLNGVAVVNVGDKFVKVLPVDQAGGAAAEFDHSDASQLPSLGGYVTHIVQLQHIKPSEMVPIIQPFSKLANSILPIDSNGILVLRDNAENVKRMLELIDQVDVSVPAEYISEVIPIKYALAEDIANALNSLGGAGGSGTVSIGSSPTATTTISGLAGRNGTTGVNGLGTQQRTTGTYGGTGGNGFGGATPNGTPAGGATTFQQRLQSIIQRASAPGQPDQIQVFGQAKIIADQRANSLLVFATEPDMERIKEVVAKLDVLLSQVLIESVIIDVELGKTFQLGVSAAQNPKVFSPSQGLAGGGGSVNGPSFLNFLNATTNGFSIGTNMSTIFGNALSPGLSYFGNIGPNWDVALQAIASDNNATVIQRPRIQTSQAKAASFFVGQTVPYVTSTYNGGAGIGNSSSYSQLSVGVELDVTPFINPDGLVVMDINQEIDDLNGSTLIEGVGEVPNTTKRTLSSEIAVKDRDTVMLGGFVRSDKNSTKSGVPFLQDIPILGALFSQRTSNKDRQETIVMIRPTVLRSPELASAQALTEEQRLPGIAHAEANDDADAQRQIEAERKAEMKAAKSTKHNAGVFTPQSPGETTGTNAVPTDMNGGAQPNPAAGLY